MKCASSSSHSFLASASAWALAIAIGIAQAVLPVAANAGSGIAISPAVRAGGMDSNLEPEPGINVQWGRAVTLVNAPLADVTAVVQDYASYRTFLPHCESSRVLSQRQASALVYVQFSVLNGARTLWAELKFRAHDAAGTTRVVEANMVKGNVGRLSAIWELTPFDEHRTLVTFRILVDPSFPLPASILSDENVSSASRTLRALRSVVAARKPAHPVAG